MDVSALKKQFAAFLFGEPGNPFKAALAVFGEDTGNACKYAVEWNNDIEVLEEIERLKNKKLEDEPLPDKTQTALEIWNLATNDFLKGKERVDAFRLFAEILGYMPEKTINKNINDATKPSKVMLVKDYGESDNWEAKLEAQQARLSNA